MVHPPQCPCGSLAYPGPDGRCLTCGRTVTAPGGWRGLGPRLAGVTLDRDGYRTLAKLTLSLSKK